MPSRSLRLLFAFAAFISLYIVKADQYVMHLEEQGTKFDEHIDVDVDKEVETFKVPPHNNVVGAAFLNNFKLGLTASRIPAHKACYISDLIPDLSRPEQLKGDLERGSQLKTGELLTETTHLKWLVQGGVDRRNLPRSLRDFCGRLPVYEAVLFPGNATGGTLRTRVQRQATTTIKKIRSCDKKNALKLVKDCMDDHMWDAVCDFKTASCLYKLTCTNTVTAKHWKCVHSHTYNLHTLCCDYTCQTK